MRNKSYYNWSNNKYELECDVEYEYSPGSPGVRYHSDGSGTPPTAPEITLVGVTVQTIHRFWCSGTIDSEWLKAHPDWDKFLSAVVKHHLQTELDLGGSFYRLLEDEIEDN
jgi:hypothetical protein